MAKKQTPGKNALPDLDPVKLRNRLALLRLGKLPGPSKNPSDAERRTARAPA